MYGAGLNI